MTPMFALALASSVAAADGVSPRATAMMQDAASAPVAPAIADAPDPRGSAAGRRPPRDRFLVVSARLETMTSEGSNGVTYVAPGFGLGLEAAFHRNLGASLRYDVSFATRGTSSLTVTRITQQMAATFDARVRVQRSASLRAGVGPGLSSTIAATRFDGSSRTSVAFEPGAAWFGALDVEIPETAFRASLGASGLWHRASHDRSYFVGVAYVFR